MLTFHVQILNERFLSHYGVDRILLLMAEHFRAMGARVTFGCIRYNAELFESNEGIVKLPAYDADTFQDIDKFVSAEKVSTDGMLAHWLIDKPDVVLVGGWPFFDLGARAGAFGVKSVFIDAGAVPHTGYSAPAQSVQQELRRIRAQTLPFFDKILPISNFIRRSQTEPDRGSAKGVRTIYLGAGHLNKTLPGPPSALLARLHEEKRLGRRLVLAAGRFEPGAYKNSMSAVDVVRGIAGSISDVRLLILHPAEHLQVAEDVKGLVIGIGNPTDSELLEIIRLVELTLSTSLWEGFNLPLAESQYEGCPTLCYACGSHPEVTADPWFLCRTESEMAVKAVRILNGQMPDVCRKHLQAYRERFSWDETLQQIWLELKEYQVAQTTADEHGRRLVFLDISSVSPASLGREAFRQFDTLLRHLPYQPCVEMVYVEWNHDERAYVLANALPGEGRVGYPTSLFATADHMRIRADLLQMACSQRCVLPPLMLFGFSLPNEVQIQRLQWLRDKGFIAATILSENSDEYMDDQDDIRPLPSKQLGRVLAMDAVLFGSERMEREALRLSALAGRPPPPYRRVLARPAAFGGFVRPSGGDARKGGQVSVAVVLAPGSSTNADALVEAFALLDRRFPEYRFDVSVQTCPRHGYFAGNFYKADFSIRQNETKYELMEEISRADVVICPSTKGSIEFVVSMGNWLGKPCICQESESIVGYGGCVATDMSSSERIARAVSDIAMKPGRYEVQMQQAWGRPMDDVSNFVEAVAVGLADL